MRPLATACASALCLLLLPARGQAQHPDVAVALEAGAAWTHSHAVYEPFEDAIPSDPSADHTDTATRWGPAGAISLSLAWPVQGRLRLGGMLRAGFAHALRSAFGDEGESQTSFAAGPMLRIEPERASPGPYAGVWGGFAMADSRWLGWSVGVDAGYRFAVAESWSLGIGATLTGQWSYDGEDGDHGHYDYLQRSVWPTLHLRVTHPLGS